MYPEHDHLHDEQEEVYTALSGSAVLMIGEESYVLEPGVFARVGPGQKRKLVTGEQGARLLCLGGTPGRPTSRPPGPRRAVPCRPTRRRSTTSG